MVFIWFDQKSSSPKWFYNLFRRKAIDFLLYTAKSLAISITMSTYTYGSHWKISHTHTQWVWQLNIYLTRLAYLAAKLQHTHEREKRKILVIPFWKSFLWLFGRNFSEFWDWSQSSALLSIATECNFKSKRTSHKWKKKKKKKYFICMWFRYYVKRFMCRVYCYSCGKQYEWCENGGYTINWFHVMDEHSVSFHWYANRKFSL